LISCIHTKTRLDLDFGNITLHNLLLTANLFSREATASDSCIYIGERADQTDQSMRLAHTRWEWRTMGVFCTEQKRGRWAYSVYQQLHSGIKEADHTCCLLFSPFTLTPASWRTGRYNFHERNVMSISSPSGRIRIRSPGV
jgi:hypothetical protein